MTIKEFNELKVNQMGDSIYHYSSLTVLGSILNNKELWLSDTSQMNDFEEEMYLINDMNEKLKEDLSKEYHIKCDYFFDHVRNRLIHEYPYAMCFSCLEDDVSMWERYAYGVDGIRIAFNTEKMVALFCNGKTDLSKVQYGVDMRNHGLFKIVKEYLEKDKLVTFEKPRHLIDNILSCATIHKNRGFESESECRITTFWGNFLLGKPEFVKSGGVIKRVIKINMDKLCAEKNINFEDLFSNILIGPKSEQNLEILKSYIKGLGYDALAKRVYRSKCPLR